jgi:uncharacterized protein with von Willebrand factor type A (vWA) domain
MSGVVAYPARREAAPPLTARLVGFVRLLRDNGFAVGAGEAVDAGRLARGVDLMDANELRWGLRALLCARRADWRRFDELFDAYWRRHGMRRAVRAVGDPGHAALRRLPGARRRRPPDQLEPGGPGGRRRALRGGASARALRPPTCATSTTPTARACTS